MRILIAGATSVLGLPLTAELRQAGHEVFGLSRSPARRAVIEARGGRAVIGDVFDRQGLASALAAVEPEVVISLLITLPKNGPRRASQVHPNLGLWSEGVPNLIAAAQRTKARRLLAESFVFVYGYGRYGPQSLSEDAELSGGAVIAGQRPILEGLRGMEAAVAGAEGIEGIVLRYGGFHGPGVPMTATMAKALRYGIPVLPGGGHALLPFIALSDAVQGTVAAMDRGSGGETYNLVDDRPSEVRDFAASLSAAIERRRLGQFHWPWSDRLLPTWRVF